MSNSVGDSFERTFLDIPLNTQTDHCDEYELAPLILRLFKSAQPVLEAGCGSGRWNAWLARQGIWSVGLDWSEGLCRRAASELPDCSFIAGDMQTMPLRAHAFGGLIALGSVEHTSAGPLKALREFRRVLKAGGVAVVTVPYVGRLRRALLLTISAACNFEEQSIFTQTPQEKRISREVATERPNRDRQIMIPGI
jgi:ubiquinone/menaquinone biosynthesis C-methylase UbiE